MFEKVNEKIIFLVISLLFLAIGLWGNNQLQERPGLPFQVKSAQDQLIISSIDSGGEVGSPSIQINDTLLALNNITVRNEWELDFLVDTFHAGDSLKIKLQRNNQHFGSQISLTLKYQQSPILYYLIGLGFLFWIVGVLVYLNKLIEWAARVFTAGSMSIIVIIMHIWPSYALNSHSWLHYLIAAIYWFLYSLAPAFVLYFMLLYPHKKQILLKWPRLAGLIFRPALIFILLLEVSFFSAALTRDLSVYQIFYAIYNLGFRIYFIVYLILSIGCLLHSLFEVDSRAARHKIQWILWGLIFGLTPYLFLWSFPKLLELSPLITEGVNYIFMTSIPLAFAVSFFKYQLFDIETILGRSLVYISVTGIVALLFILFKLTATIELGHIIPNSYIGLIIIFIISAVAFLTPLIWRLQQFIYKTFFEIKFKFRLILDDCAQAITRARDQEQLIQLFLNSIHTAIPLKKAALILKDSATEVFEVQGSFGLLREELTQLRFPGTSQLIRLIENKNMPLVKKSKIDTTESRPETATSSRTARFITYKILLWSRIISHKIIRLFSQPLPNVDELPPLPLFDQYEFQLLIPIREQQHLMGFMLLGEKLSRVRFFKHDLHLLSQMLRDAFSAIERLRLREKIQLELAEKEQLAELNQLKSEFISHVSHELRTPLTAIRWSVENLLDGIPEEPTPKIREYLTGIHDSTQHLSRMIENLLDISRIEADRIEVFPEKLNLAAEIHHALELLKPSADQKEIQFDLNLNPELWLKADRDHLQAIFVNLLENAIKYSLPGNNVRIQTYLIQSTQSNRLAYPAGDMVEISIRDDGIGIPAEKLATIFEIFERVKTEKTAREKGLGLGLHIVKKLVELQGGQIRVESEVQKGSTFYVTLPNV